MRARAAPPGRIGALREAVIVAAYAVAFFGALPAFLWALGGRLDLVLRLPAAGGNATRAVGAALALAGAAWFGWAVREFRVVGRGWPISHLPPARLVTSGPYRVMRHPDYVGYTAGFVGAALVSGSLGRAVGAGALLTAGWLIYALGFEEPRLGRRIGEPAYARYRSRTPLLPFPPGVALARALRRRRKPARPAAWRPTRTAASRAGRW